MILLIDNYDSFSYNLVQLIGTINPDIMVIRNDEKTIKEIEKLNPSHIIISPGPGRPADAGIIEDVVKSFGGSIPILGVCLGHQAICEAFGASITYAKKLYHGKQSVVTLDNNCEIFKGLPAYVPVARYHSLAADAKTMPQDLSVVARADDGEVMAVAHRQFDIYGLQFHPESIMTPEGISMLKNFLNISQGDRRWQVQ
ncbi:MAG: aminodeoxychorismate/anthranilate synthase component II [Pseudobutyrivibrio sp.]|nr:aminodeoxychorismate/anthranilate synthase component II [Pseudobutyrivibrio sp.]